MKWGRIVLRIRQVLQNCLWESRTKSISEPCFDVPEWNLLLAVPQGALQIERQLVWSSGRERRMLRRNTEALSSPLICLKTQPPSVHYVQKMGFFQFLSLFQLLGDTAKYRPDRLDVRVGVNHSCWQCSPELQRHYTYKLLRGCLQGELYGCGLSKGWLNTSLNKQSISVLFSLSNLIESHDFSLNTGTRISWQNMWSNWKEQQLLYRKVSTEAGQSPQLWSHIRAKKNFCPVSDSVWLPHAVLCSCLSGRQVSSVHSRMRRVLLSTGVL